MGASPSSSDSTPSDSASSPDGAPRSATPPDSDASEKWLVRILLALAFGLAFGIEGMTLVRSFLIDDEPAAEQSETDPRPMLAEGGRLVPSVAPDVRARRLRLRAGAEEWTFTLAARPDTLADRPVTVTFDRLTLSNGTELTAGPSHTWAAADTATFAASWSLPVGQRPEALTVTATTEAVADSTLSGTRTVRLGHVPVRQR